MQATGNKMISTPAKTSSGSKVHIVGQVKHDPRVKLMDKLKHNDTKK